MQRKKITSAFSLLIVVLLLPGLATAQEADDQRFFMLNQHQCYGQYMDEVKAHFDDEAAPALDALAEEGLILDWGVLEHAWGDEWNWNFYIVTESHSSFLEAFREFAQRTGDPFENSDFGEWCFAHKDNLYTLSDWG